MLRPAKGPIWILCGLPYGSTDPKRNLQLSRRIRPCHKGDSRGVHPDPAHYSKGRSEHNHHPEAMGEPLETGKRADIVVNLWAAFWAL